MEHGFAPERLRRALPEQYGWKRRNSWRRTNWTRPCPLSMKECFCLFPGIAPCLWPTLWKCSGENFFPRSFPGNEGNAVAPATDGGQASTAFPGDVAGSASAPVWCGRGGTDTSRIRREEPRPRPGWHVGVVSSREDTEAVSIPLDQGVQSHGSRLWREHVVVRGETLYAFRDAMAFRWKKSPH
jgi:hypothetical protein